MKMFNIPTVYSVIKDILEFTIVTSHTDKWTGIGLSDNEKMVKGFNRYRVAKNNSFSKKKKKKSSLNLVQF